MVRLLGLNGDLVRHYTGAVPHMPTVSPEEMLQVLRLTPHEIEALKKYWD
jgi:hypothetical protein